MTTDVGFGRFVALDADDAPELLARMSKRELAVDGQRYGISTRLIARSDVTVVDLASAVVRKLIGECSAVSDRIGALVLTSRIEQVDSAAETVVNRLGLRCTAHGIERACSGFPAATELALTLYQRTQQPVVVVAAEIISGSINWETPDGDLADQKRARGQASKLFADGAAAVLVQSSEHGPVHHVLDAWIDDVPDEQQLIQKADIADTVDPWGKIRPGVTGCISMPGRRGFHLVKRAPQIMADAVARSLQRANGRVDPEDRIDHVIPHQANGLIIDRLRGQLAERYNPPPQVWDCIEHSGNTVSASIPLAMVQTQDHLPPGALVAMPSVGAGGPGYRPSTLSTGCVLLRTGAVPNGS